MKKALFLFILLFFICPIFVFAASTVDINTATMAQLDTLTGIGPVYAQRIIDGRPYSSIDDLDKVKGIGPATLQKIKDQGLAYVGENFEIQNPKSETNLNPLNPNDQNPPPAPVPVITYPSGVFINEILPNPEGADETEEWIELYNSGISTVDLSGWQIQDTTGTASTYTLPAGTKLLARGFLVLKRPDTKIMLNNDADDVNLLTPDKKVVSSANFISAPLGQSYNNFSDNWKWSTTLTPGAKNIIPVAKALPSVENSANNGSIKAEDLTAGLSQPISPGTNPWPMFLAVLSSTIILAVVVLLIKLKINHVRT